jgi:AdoMet-dependent rRNA methyltransferase SPB1
MSDGESIKSMSESELPNLPLSDKQQKKLKNKEKANKKEHDAKKKRGKKRSGPEDESASETEAGAATFEVVPSTMLVAPATAEEAAEIQAYGSLLISKKSRIAAIEAGYHRFAYDEDAEAAAALPEWFVEEERRNTQASIPLTKELAAQMRAKMREINARPIRKVAEAMGRKANRAQLKLEKIRKQATSLAATEDLGGKTKAREIAKAVSKMKREEKRKVVYTVVSKQGAPGKQVSKGKAGKGAKVKVVDRRLKKDTKAAKRAIRKRK